VRERNFNSGRSAVYAENGMAASAHPQATLTAVDVLRRGGNAVDAAVAACALLCVIEPHATGVGGDCFAIVSKAGGRPFGLNGSGRAPAAATLDWYLERGMREIELPTPHAVTVPGAVDAWCRLVEDHGTLPLAELLAPAVQAAEQGYVVAPRVARDWAELADKLARDPNTRRIFLPDGRAPKAGGRHRQPELARSLRRIAEQGRAGFYEGPVAEDIVGRLRELGGLHTLDDSPRPPAPTSSRSRAPTAATRCWSSRPTGRGSRRSSC
jgi:gamma-glutamyltranspeptidase / glutathione hydrolase